MKFSPLKADSKKEYEKTKFHNELKKHHLVTTHKIFLDKDEMSIIYKVKDQPKVTIEVVIDRDTLEFIFIGVGDAKKGRASIASNPKGITESIDEVLKVVENHIKRDTFEKLRINVSDLKKLLEEETEEVFDSELEELEELRDTMNKNIDRLNEILETDENGFIILRDGLPILKGTKDEDK